MVGKNGELVFHGYRVSVWEDGKSSGDMLVMVARMYLMPLNHTLNMVNMTNFTLCIFYHNKKSLFLKSRYDST